MKSQDKIAENLGFIRKQVREGNAKPETVERAIQATMALMGWNINDDMVYGYFKDYVNGVIGINQLVNLLDERGDI